MRTSSWLFPFVIITLLVYETSSNGLETDFFAEPATCDSDVDCLDIHHGALCVTYDVFTPTSSNSTIATTEDKVKGRGKRPKVTSSLPLNSTSSPLNATAVTTANWTDNGFSSGYEPDNTTIIITSMTKCRCNSDAGFHKEGDSCVKHVGVGKECSNDETTVCRDPNSVCQDDGSNYNRYRCLCKPRRTKAYLGGRYQCVAIITTLDDESCQSCESNEGTCYDVTGDGLRDGCICPSTRSGNNCSSLHVIVKCDVDAFEMIICYKQHDHIDFSDGISLHVTGRDNDEMCKGNDVDVNDTQCPGADTKLVLDLHEPGRGRCGTKEITRIPNRRSFENQLTAAPLGPVIDTSNSVTFTAFCKFTTNAETSFNGMSINGVPGNDRGMHRQPNLGLRVMNAFGRPIPEDARLRLGDMIQFQIGVEDDGVYSALRVEQCSASSSAVIPDPKAVVVPLTISSCPADGQKFIDQDNNWRPVGGSVNTVQTGLIPMFKLSTGRSVFLHCAVKLCLKGAENECSPVMCTKPVGHYGYGRKRRSTDQIGQVTRELRWYNDTEPDESAKQVSGQEDLNSTGKGVIVLDTTSFSMLVLFLGVLLVIFMVMAGLLYYKLRRGNFTNSRDNLVEKPQRFALPRITRNTFRI